MELRAPAGCLQGLGNQMSPAPIDNLSPQALDFLATSLVPAAHRQCIAAQPSWPPQGPTGAWVFSPASVASPIPLYPSPSQQFSSLLLLGDQTRLLLSEELLGDLSLCCNQNAHVLDVYNGPLRCSLKCYKKKSSGLFFYKFGTNSWE